MTSKSASRCHKVCEIRHDVKRYVVTSKSVSLRQEVSHGVKRYVVIAKHHYVQNVIKKYVITYIENIKKYVKKKHIMR